MRILDNLRVAIAGINSNKLRSALTTLGVLIGVSAVIILVAVGTGSSQAVESRINRLGTNTLTVFNTGRFGRGVSANGTQSQQASLTISDVNALQNPNDAPDVKSVSPVISTSQTATYDGATYSTTVDGSTSSYLSAEDYTVQAGSAISSQDVASHAQVVDIGSDVASNLFTTSENPLGKTIMIGSTNFEVIGVLASKGSSGLQNQDAVAIAPYTAVEDHLTGYSQSFSQLIVQGKSASTLNLAQSEVENILAAQNDTTVADLPFQVLNQATLLSTAQATSSTFTVLLGAVAAISLLVGGIGVMNIMLVTVTGTHPRDRYPQGDRRHEVGDPHPIPLRVGPPMSDRRSGRCPHRCRREPVQDRRRTAGDRAVLDRARLRRVDRRRGLLRVLPRQPGRFDATHRRPSL